jgi:hypothetical protein
VQLTGVVSTKGNSLLTTFDKIPDVPLSQFTLRFAGGKKTALLQANSDMCAAKEQNIVGTFVAQSGKTITTQSPLAVDGCPPVASGAVRGLAGGKPGIRLTLRRAASGGKLGQVTITLPRGMTFDKGQMKRGLKVTAGAKKVSGAKVLSSRVLQLPRLPGGSVDSLRAAFSKGFVRTSRSLAKKKTPALTFTFAAVDASKTKFTVKKTVIGH